MMNDMNRLYKRWMNVMNELNEWMKETNWWNDGWNKSMNCKDQMNGWNEWIIECIIEWINLIKWRNKMNEDL